MGVCLKKNKREMMIGVEDLFNLFPEGESKKETTYIDVASTPLYWLGMHKKLILNHINFKKKIIHYFKKNNDELDVAEIEKAGEFVAYNRAWSYIKKIDMGNEDHIADIVSYGDAALETSLELAIKHFQNTEEYEKCAHILKILKKSQEF